MVWWADMVITVFKLLKGYWVETYSAWSWLVEGSCRHSEGGRCFREEGNF